MVVIAILAFLAFELALGILLGRFIRYGSSGSP